MCSPVQIIVAILKLCCHVGGEVGKGKGGGELVNGLIIPEAIEMERGKKFDFCLELL